MAFNGKNLHYDKQEPAFLRKLRGEFGGLDGRHNVQIARPKKDRLKTGDEDEDDPVIVDEQGERVEKAEFERRVREGDEPGVEEGEESPRDDPGEKSNETQNERQKVAEIGSAVNAKKRKSGKIVGGEDQDGANPSGKDSKPETSKRAHESDALDRKKKDPIASKKKGKKIKLSFDDADG